VIFSRKIIIFLGLLIFFLGRASLVSAAGSYLIKDFTSQITLNQDTSLTVSEKIEVDFSEQRHGIIRVVPVIYSAGFRPILSQLKVLSVVDNQNQPIPYQAERFEQSSKITIGDTNKTIIGPQTYVITYQIKRVVLSYQGQPEIYWNVIGSEWDTVIEKASAVVFSDFAEIKKVDCFAGLIQGKDKFCESSFQKNQADFKITQEGGYGSDFTVVIGLDQNNQLHFPGFLQRLAWGLKDNWGYLAALLPLLVMLLAWWRWGRDKRFLSENIYFQPGSKKQRNVSPFERSHLPLVYHPIDGLTPAQVGTIIDERVHLKDVLAEIVELARLGFLKIKKTTQKKFLGTRDDYVFIKVEKKTEKLTNYQKYLWEKIFEKGSEVKLIDLKDKFAVHIGKMRDLIYESLVKKKVFPQNPYSVRILWIILIVFLSGFAFFSTVFYTAMTVNPGPMILFFPALIPAFFLTQHMGRKTAWGYSLYRQTVGLRWYLEKGKWREEIAEKNLFFEEILPLAMALGIVEKLAKEMAVLGVEPPSYFQGVAMSSFGRDFNSFNALAGSNLSSTPSSGKSSWSGGSGFSGGGGSSGGGFGGGGGSSW
jgi:uncharacterized membrane protein